MRPADASKAVERVGKLIAQATGTTFEGEARTAALMACQLIKEAGLRIVAPESRSARTESAPRPNRKTERRPTTATTASPTWTRIRVRFASVCRSCERDVPIGASAYWSRGFGVKCLSCQRGDE